MLAPEPPEHVSGRLGAPSLQHSEGRRNHHGTRPPSRAVAVGEHRRLASATHSRSDGAWNRSSADLADFRLIMDLGVRLSHGPDLRVAAPGHAPICQDTRSGGLDDLLASAEIGHDALVDLASEKTFQAPDDFSLGSAVRRAACDVVDLPAFFGPMITGEQRRSGFSVCVLMPFVLRTRRPNGIIMPSAGQSVTSSATANIIVSVVTVGSRLLRHCQVDEKLVE